VRVSGHQASFKIQPAAWKRYSNSGKLPPAAAKTRISSTKK